MENECITIGIRVDSIFTKIPFKTQITKNLGHFGQFRRRPSARLGVVQAPYQASFRRILGVVQAPFFGLQVTASRHFWGVVGGVSLQGFPANVISPCCMRPSSPIGWRGISSNNTGDRRCRTAAMPMTCPLSNRPLGEASFWRRLGSRRRRCGVFLATPSFGVILAPFAFGSVTAMPHGEAVSITTYDAAVSVLWRSEHHCQLPLKDENALNFYDLFAIVGVNSFVFFLLFIFVWVAINKQNGIIYIYISHLPSLLMLHSNGYIGHGSASLDPMSEEWEMDECHYVIDSHHFGNTLLQKDVIVCDDISFSQ